jgi:PBP1b-binding outer membrane lipoprotein LpoB
MKQILTILTLALLFGGCAAKIVPGHVDKTEVQKATPEMSKEPEPVKPKPVAQVEQKVSMPEIEAEANVTAVEVKEVNASGAVVQEETIVEESEEETTKPRFPRSQMIDSSPYKVTMKTKKFAFSDTGFLNRYDN